MTRPAAGLASLAAGVLALVAAAQAAAPPQPPAAPAQPPPSPTFRTGAAAVVLDIVVRDRRGRPVRDLRADEVTVSEDGSPRAVQSFRFVEGAPPAGGDSGSPAAQPDPLRRITLVTLVFDHLTQNGRRLARQAALEFVSREMPPGQWAAVFTMDQRLRLLQDFSRDREALLRAVERAGSAVAREAAPAAAGTSREQDAAPAYGRVGEAELSAAERAGTGDVGAAAAQAKMREIAERMQQFSDSAESQQRGQSTLFPLMALARAQGALEGRKAILFFSEGFHVPPNLEEAFRSAISEANRANVSVYAIDSRGLDTGRDLAAAGAALEKAGRVSQQALAKRGADGVSIDEVMNVDTAQSALRGSTQGALAELAESTGGLLIANSNDLGKGLDRVAADLAGYYEVAYTPKPGEADGAFRKVEVKVARRGVEVAARSGYFALPAADGAPLMPFELPLLAAAAAPEPPRAFAYRVAAFAFHDTPRGRHHTIVAEVPLEHLQIQEDRRARRYAIRFTVMALVKDAAGRVVARLSNTYPLEGPLENVPALRRGHVVFTRQLWLPPGNYTVACIVGDQGAGRASVERLTLAVPVPRPGVQVSSVAVIRKVDRVEGEAGPVEDPFRAGALKIVPSLDDPISKAATPQLSAYLVVYPDGSSREPPGLTVEFLRGDRVVGRSTAELPAADESGRITYVASFPTAGFEPGIYALRMVASQGGSLDEARARFTVIP